MPERVIFFVDGFNVYHSIKEGLKANVISHGKWLNYWSFSESLLKDVMNFDRAATMSEVRLFSALATHLSDKSVAARHRSYNRALETVGVAVKLGNFKRKKVQCRASCREQFDAYEEKETDVNIAISVLQSLIEDLCDTAVIISGDTDLVAVVTTAKSMYPHKRIAVGFPYLRDNNHFRGVADFTFKIKAKRYERHQLPDPVIHPDGSLIHKPPSW